MDCSKRNKHIDFFRFLGFSLIVLAHVSAPHYLTQFRCFDVPLMLFVSGLAVSNKTVEHYIPYLVKRSCRLVVPVWLFLMLYLSAFYFAQFILLPEQYLTGKMIIRSFFFLDRSIGYVWIIRVFLLIMIVTPLVQRIVLKCKNLYDFVGLLFINLLLSYGLYNVLCDINNMYVQFLLNDMLLYCISYLIPFLVGLKVQSFSGKETIGLILFVGSLLVAFFVCNAIVEGWENNLEISDVYKVPPHVYYILYGTFMSLILWNLKSKIDVIANLMAVKFIGQNTIWIYLWHMPFALFSTVFIDHWLVRYFVVYGGALLLFSIQYYIVNKYKCDFGLKYLRG